MSSTLRTNVDANEGEARSVGTATRLEPSRHRWTILAVGTAAQAALSALQGGFPALGPALRAELGLSLAQVGVVLTAAGWGVVALLLAWGWIADRFGARLVMSVGLAGSSGALVAASFVHGMWPLTACLAAAGGLGGSAATAGPGIVMGWFAQRRRALVLSIRQTAVPVGGAAGATVLPFLVGAGGLRAALLGLAVFAASAAVAAALWIREPPANGPRTAKAAPPGPSPLRDLRLWRLATGCGLLVCPQVATFTFVVLFLHEHRNLSTSAAAGMLAAIQLGSTASRLLTGRWSDRRGSRMIPLRRMALAVTATMAATALLADGPLAALLPVLFVAGSLAAGWNGVSATATVEIAGRERAATAIGVQQTVMRGVGGAAGVGFGVLVTATSWPTGWGVFALLALAGWWVLGSLAREEAEGKLPAAEGEVSM